MNITSHRLAAQPERTVYTIDVGNMSRKDAQIVFDKMMAKYRSSSSKQKEPSLMVKAMELIGSSGFGIHI